MPKEQRLLHWNLNTIPFAIIIILLFSCSGLGVFDFGGGLGFLVFGSGVGGGLGFLVLGSGVFFLVEVKVGRLMGRFVGRCEGTEVGRLVG